MFTRGVCLFVVAVAALSCSTVVAQPKKEADPASLEKAGESFVVLLAKGEFAKATKNFDAAMLKAMPSEELKKTWATIQSQAGAFKKQTGSRREAAGGYEIVLVTCEFEKAALDARVVFDKDKKIAGLAFNPAAKPKPMGEEEIWEGALKVGTVELRLAFHLFKQKDGSYAATMDSPDQGQSGIPLDTATVKDDKVHLELKSAQIVFEGKRDKDGLKLTGDFKQAGQSFPLTLKKAAKAKESESPAKP